MIFQFILQCCSRTREKKLSQQSITFHASATSWIRFSVLPFVNWNSDERCRPCSEYCILLTQNCKINGKFINTFSAIIDYLHFESAEVNFKMLRARLWTKRRNELYSFSFQRIKLKCPEWFIPFSDNEWIVWEMTQNAKEKWIHELLVCFGVNWKISNLLVDWKIQVKSSP